MSADVSFLVNHTTDTGLSSVMSDLSRLNMERTLDDDDN